MRRESAAAVEALEFYYGHNIFLNNKENIVMLKLGMNHSIHSIEQCMTFNEIENFEKELESEN